MTAESSWSNRDALPYNHTLSLMVLCRERGYVRATTTTQAVRLSQERQGLNRVAAARAMMENIRVKIKDAMKASRAKMKKRTTRSFLRIVGHRRPLRCLREEMGKVMTTWQTATRSISDLYAFIPEMLDVFAVQEHTRERGDHSWSTAGDQP